MNLITLLKNKIIDFKYSNDEISETECNPLDDIKDSQCTVDDLD